MVLKHDLDGEPISRKKRKPSPSTTARVSHGSHPANHGSAGNLAIEAGNRRSKTLPHSLHGSSSKSKPLRPGDSLRQKARALLPIRQSLPIWSRLSDVRDSLRDNHVMLLVGETGSGKSTQIPQILIDEPWCRPQIVRPYLPDTDSRGSKVSVGGCIAVTEPRRVAAISLARRVAAEMGSPLGSASPTSKVGYSVRFDSSTSPGMRIKYLTEGMLLQELLHDPWLRQYSAVIVDEIHERGVNVDLVAGFLRNLVTGRREGRGGLPLRVIVMSATADVDVLREFFQRGYIEQRDHGSTQSQSKPPNPIVAENVGSQSESFWSGLSEDDSKTEARVAQAVDKSEYQPDRASKDGSYPITVCTIKGRQYPVRTFYTKEPVPDVIDAALTSIIRIHHESPLPGDILTFLTGQDDIEALEQLLKDYSSKPNPGVPKLSVLCLFAALPQQIQQNVFSPAKTPNTRKVILATNIAETSVTVPGVKYVVDCGKAKIKQFRTRLGLDSLLVKTISKASALQRQGRAGREAAGECHRLYTERDFIAFEQNSTPEILRCDVTQTVMNIKARGVGDILSFPFLDAPPREALEKALMQLFTLGALSQTGEISELGRDMSKLPLTPALSRVLFAATDLNRDCLAEVIDIISALTVENVFRNVVSEEEREKAAAARVELLRREGDHLTLLATVQRYVTERSDRRAWSERHYLSHRAMQSIVDVRKQLRAICRQQKKLSVMDDDGSADVSITPERAENILHCFLKGFANKTARLCPDGSYKTVVGNHTIAIHPSSVLFGRKVEAIVYNEYVFTNKSYAKGVSAVQMSWIGQALGV
ncbi:MAG: hypothetical protein M1825_001740 [Sarcosagium campestre]|nr:MAG: hypothetical protein M1825_001740 [Sarcosagium campestre]